MQSEPTAFELHNCLGIAVSHGLSVGMGVPEQKFIMYQCFSSVKLVAKGQKIKRGSGSRGRTPVLKGDALALDLETGGTALIYWDGKTYKGFGLARGD